MHLVCFTIEIYYDARLYERRKITYFFVSTTLNSKFMENCFSEMLWKKTSCGWGTDLMHANSVQYWWCSIRLDCYIFWWLWQKRHSPNRVVRCNFTRCWFRDMNLIISVLTSIALFVNVTGNSSSSIDRNWGLGWRSKMAYFLSNTQHLHKLDAYFACHTSRLCADELVPFTDHWSQVF